MLLNSEDHSYFDTLLYIDKVFCSHVINKCITLKYFNLDFSA